jgi:hypothetical protein
MLTASLIPIVDTCVLYTMLLEFGKSGEVRALLGFVSSPSSEHEQQGEHEQVATRIRKELISDGIVASVSCFQRKICVEAYQ